MKENLIKRAYPSTLSRHKLVLSFPFDLELDFFGSVFALVLDVVAGANGNVDALVGDLDFELLALF